MSHVVAAIGATCLGIVVGWLVRYFIRRFTSFSAASLTSVVSIVAGGAAIKFLGKDNSVWWYYPIGLFLGFAIYQVIAMVSVARERADAGKSLPLIKFSKDNPTYFQKF